MKRKLTVGSFEKMKWKCCLGTLSPDIASAVSESETTVNAKWTGGKKAKIRSLLVCNDSYYSL